MDKPVLYYFPLSYHSQRALLALYEKDARFQHKLVFIHAGEQNDPAYMRMNPAGQVPVLRDGKKIVTESDAMIKYVDKHVHPGPTLIPDESSSVGKEVNRLWKLINSVNDEILTYGILIFHDLSTSSMHPMAHMMAKEIDPEKCFEEGKNLKNLAGKYPDLKDAYTTKINHALVNLFVFRDREFVTQVLAKVKKTLDDIEKALKRNHEEQGTTDSWLVGPYFTAADIALTTLLDRIVFLGLADRYFAQNIRPFLYNYYQKLGTRKSVQKVRALVSSTPQLILIHQIKKAFPYLLGVLVAGIAVFVAFRQQ